MRVAFCDAVTQVDLTLFNPSSVYSSVHRDATPFRFDVSKKLEISSCLAQNVSYLATVRNWSYVICGFI